MGIFSRKPRKSALPERFAPPSASNPVAPTVSDIGAWSQNAIEPKPVRGTSSEEAVRARAHEIWLGRGGGEGHDLADWLCAEREIQSSSDAAILGGST